MGKITTNILGTDYEIALADLNDPETAGVDGKCYTYEKRIMVRHPKYLFTQGDSKAIKNIRFREVLIHELIHAFNYESGCQYDNDEVLVDWMAHMIPLIAKRYNEIIGQLEEEEDGDNDK